MANQPPSQEQRKQQAGSQSSPPQPGTKSQNASDLSSMIDVKEDAGHEKKSGFKLGELTATVGRAGEKNLAIDKFNVRVGNNLPCGFRVSTLPGNGLEITIEQLAYKKIYTGTGEVTTQVCPVAPIGTKGKITVRDTTTGETLEQPWTWYLIGLSGGGAGLWEMIKRLFWKSGE
jgi:hypothetical protein